MKVIVFSSNSNLVDSIKAKNMEVAVYTPPQMNKIINNSNDLLLVYIDSSSFNDKLQKKISFLTSKEKVYFGVLDPDNTIKDVAELYFAGAVDYISKNQLKSEFNEKRFKRVFQYLEHFRIDYRQEIEIQKTITKNIKHITAEKGWQEIVPGAEYTFSIMFIELDGKYDMEKIFGKKNLEVALSVFRKYLERNISHFGGRIWMWFQFGGIALFPFNGRECESVYCGFRIMLYKLMHDVEESLFPNFISFRIALLLGNVTYQDNDTGNVISDSINTIFHLGRKHAATGNFYVTEEILQYAPKPLQAFFTPADNFEGIPIYKMRRPVLPS
ncbi:MAG: hypothetical protein JW822_01835 [Spirochaetales bacterium]|nr:hypothetical protein [Spirochaetales bacterium]